MKQNRGMKIGLYVVVPKDKRSHTLIIFDAIRIDHEKDQKYPNLWFRFWHRILLGWIWENKNET